MSIYSTFMNILCLKKTFKIFVYCWNKNEYDSNPLQSFGEKLACINIHGGKTRKNLAANVQNVLLITEN